MRRLLALSAALALAAATAACTHRADSRSTGQTATREARLAPDGGQPFAAVDKEAFKIMYKAKKTNAEADATALGSAFVSGAIFTVKWNTRVRVLGSETIDVFDGKYEAVRVEILEGDKAGKVGWVSYKWLK